MATNKTTNTMPPHSQPLHLPRILCLHGSGSSSRIFSFQSRGLISILCPYYRLIFADAPFLSSAGPGILPFFEGMEPYRRWLPPTAVQGGEACDIGLSEKEVRGRVERACREAMEGDEDAGGTGEWVGIVGFSQGGKMAGSLLFDTQLRLGSGTSSRNSDSEDESVQQGFAGVMWRFAIIIAGQEPLVRLSEYGEGCKRLVDASGDVYGEGWVRDEMEDRLRLPTIHVHGLKDKWLEGHKRLLEEVCKNENARLVEWDGDHRLPVKSEDLTRVLEAVLDVSVELGILDAPERSKLRYMSPTT